MRGMKATSSAKQLPPQFAIGVDFGTNSVRSLVVDIRDFCINMCKPLYDILF